jgi:uncharacterized membrane protein YfhO
VSLEFRHSDAIVVQTLADAPATLEVRSSFAPGWRASVSGAPAPVSDQDGHLAVAVPAGPSRVELRYSPPGLFRGLVLAALSLVVLAWLVRKPRWPDATVPSVP